VGWPARRPAMVKLVWDLTALGVAAGQAGVAAFPADETCAAATRAEARPRALRWNFRVRQDAGSAAAQQADIDHVALDHLADGGQKRWHIAPAHPLPAARV